MKALTLQEMQKMQKELHEKYGKGWIQLSPENGHYSVLWALGEMGEVIDVIKKQGHKKIMNDAETRTHFIAELSDVMMFLMDILTCYGISSEEFRESYIQKHLYNMKRWEE